MADVSLMVLTEKDERARFLVERRGAWQDGDMGLQKDWVSAYDALLKAFSRLLNPGAAAPLPRFWVQSQCRELYRQVVPDATKRVLKDTLENAPAGSTPTLRIYSDGRFDGVPWELLHDEQDYLGLRWRISRMPIVPDPPSAGAGIRTVKSIFHVLGKDVVTVPGEPGIFDQWLHTFGSLSTQNYPASEVTPSWPSVDVIEEACSGDILHITCHGLPGGGGWTLDQNGGEPSVIGTTLVDNLALREGRPLIFANACNSTNGPTGIRAGLAPRFISRGTLNLVGTFAPVTRNKAIQFAEHFYRLLLSGDEKTAIPIAEALRLTKRHFHELPLTGQYDPSYLFYSLYGPADSRFVLQPAAPAGEG